MGNAFAAAGSAQSARDEATAHALRTVVTYEPHAELIASRLAPRSYDPGETLLAADAEARFVLILSGTVALRAPREGGGEEEEICHRGPGSCVCEHVLFDSSRPSAVTAVASTPVSAVELTAAAVDELREDGVVPPPELHAAHRMRGALATDVEEAAEAPETVPLLQELAHLVRAEPYSTVVQLGQPVDAWFVLCEGSLDRREERGGGAAGAGKVGTVASTSERGYTLGETSLMHRCPATVSYRAGATRAALLRVQGSAFRAVCRAHPRLHRAVVALTVRRVQALLAGASALMAEAREPDLRAASDDTLLVSAGPNEPLAVPPRSLVLVLHGRVHVTAGDFRVSTLTRGSLAGALALLAGDAGATGRLTCSHGGGCFAAVVPVAGAARLAGDSAVRALLLARAEEERSDLLRCGARPPPLPECSHAGLCDVCGSQAAAQRAEVARLKALLAAHGIEDPGAGEAAAAVSATLEEEGEGGDQQQLEHRLLVLQARSLKRYRDILRRVNTPELTRAFHGWRLKIAAMKEAEQAAASGALLAARFANKGRVYKLVQSCRLSYARKAWNTWAAVLREREPVVEVAQPQPQPQGATEAAVATQAEEARQAAVADVHAQLARDDEEAEEEEGDDQDRVGDLPDMPPPAVPPSLRHETSTRDDSYDQPTAAAAHRSAADRTLLSTRSQSVDHTARILRAMTAFVPARVFKHAIAVADGRYTAGQGQLLTPGFGVFLTGQPERDELPAEEFQGAVLFADISGFSTLANHLVAHADYEWKPPEDLADFIGRALEKALATIISHGGDIVKFAGDACTAVFAARDFSHPSSWVSESINGLEAATMAAAMVSRMILQLYLSAANFDLAVHCGLGAGQIVGMHVGGLFSRREYIVAGDAVRQIGVAEPMAGSGECVISPEARKLLGRFAEGTELDEGNFMLDRVTFDLNVIIAAAPTTIRDQLVTLNHSQRNKVRELVARYVPRSVEMAIEDECQSFAAELRPVTTMFLRVGGLEVHSAGDHGAVHRVVVAVQEEVYGRAGSLLRFTFDDKGANFMIAFGLPPLKHADDPVRATMAAVAISDRLALDGLEAGAGITSAEVFCGSVGGNKRAEYTLHGTYVNLAARFMCHGLKLEGGSGRLQVPPTRRGAAGALLRTPQSVDLPGGRLRRVVVCEETHRRCVRAADFDRSDHPFKGFTQLVPTFVVRAVRAGSAASRISPAPHPPIGHHKTVGVIANAVADLQQRGHTDVGLVMVAGDWGLGKTELLRHVAHLARALRVVHLVPVEGAHQELCPPLVAWRGALREILGFNDADGPAGAAPAVEAALAAVPPAVCDADAARGILAWLFPQLEAPGVDEDAVRAVAGRFTPDTLALTAVRMMRDLFSHAVEHGPPTVLLVDDCHDLDMLSWLLTTRICKRASRMSRLLVVTTLLPPQHLSGSAAGEMEVARGLMELQDVAFRSGSYNQLSGLKEAEAAVLLRRRAAQMVNAPHGGADGGGLSISDRVVADLASRAAGNPGMLMELLRGAVDAKKLAYVPASRSLVSTNPNAKSVAILTLYIVSRLLVPLDMVELNAQLFARAASVMGLAFRPDVVQQIVPFPHVQSHAASIESELQHAMLIRPAPPDALGHEQFQFTSQLLRDAAKSLLLFSQRRQLHHKVATILEAELAHFADSGGDPDAQHEARAKIAYHYAKAEVLLKAAAAHEECVAYAAQSCDPPRHRVALFHARALLTLKDRFLRTHWRHRKGPCLRAVRWSVAAARAAAGLGHRGVVTERHLREGLAEIGVEALVVETSLRAKALERDLSFLDALAESMTSHRRNVFRELATICRLMARVDTRIGTMEGSFLDRCADRAEEIAHNARLHGLMLQQHSIDSASSSLPSPQQQPPSSLESPVPATPRPVALGGPSRFRFSGSEAGAGAAGSDADTETGSAPGTPRSNRPNRILKALDSEDAEEERLWLEARMARADDDDDDPAADDDDDDEYDNDDFDIGTPRAQGNLPDMLPQHPTRLLQRRSGVGPRLERAGTQDLEQEEEKSVWEAAQELLEDLFASERPAPTPVMQTSAGRTVARGVGGGGGGAAAPRVKARKRAVTTVG